MNTDKIPLSLKAVAWFSILSGMVGIVEMIIMLAHGHFVISWGILLILAGRGLLHLRRGWRMFTLVLAWLSLLGLPVTGIWFTLHPSAVHAEIPMRFAGQTVGHVHFATYALLLGFFTAYSFWQLWVLTRPQVRQLFFNGSFHQFAGANPAIDQVSKLNPS